MIPAVIIGYKYERVFEQLFGNNILLVGAMLIVTALLLFLADRAKKTHKKVSLADGFIIGILSGELTYSSTSFGYLSVGFIAAFISGLFACTWMIALVKKSKLTYFAIYCVIVGIIAIIWTQI